MEPPPIKKISFIKSSARAEDCPGDEYPEFAFTGRSNVGKSSLINMLCMRSRLARTSSTPGKTQLINHFLINDAWYLVDLPGYGYARMPEWNRQKMNRLIREYVLGSKRLACLFLLLDIRLEMQQADREFLYFLGSNRVPFVLVFTKTDKVSGDRMERNAEMYRKTLLERWETLPEIFMTSSRENKGRRELLEFIHRVMDAE